MEDLHGGTNNGHCGRLEHALESISSRFKKSESGDKRQNFNQCDVSALSSFIYPRKTRAKCTKRKLTCVILGLLIFG